MSTSIDMKGKVALVTGAASGLGRAAAIKLAKAGADLYLVDINPGGLEETAGEARAMGVRVRVQAADLSVRDNCVAAVAATVKEFGRLDALCNVAGIIVMCHAHEMSEVDYERTIAINLNAPFYLMQAAIPHLLERDGAVVNVTSSAAYVGEAYAVAYCATKAALNHMTKALAMEYMHKTIRFNAVAPGGMNTGIGKTIKFPPDTDFTLVKRYSGMRGMVEIDDVAEAILLLASPAGRGYHGSCITLDKGITAG